MRMPKTDVEWQDAVDGAEACLAIDSARQYGLVKGGPKINVARCDKILTMGRARGVRPAPDAIERFCGELMRKE